MKLVLRRVIIYFLCCRSRLSAALTISEARSRYHAWFEVGKRNRVASHTVESEDIPVDPRLRRLSHFAAQIFPNTLQTSNSANVACRKKQLKLNGMNATGAEIVCPGDTLSLSLPPDRRCTIPDNQERAQKWCQKRVNLFKVLSDDVQSPPLSILYEDDCMAIVCKPSGIHSMSWKSTLGRGVLCLDELLPLMLTPPKESPDPLTSPLPRHRLDARVAGPLVVAKTKRALVQLGRSFESGTAVKEYRAMLVGSGGLLRDLPELPAESKPEPQLLINHDIDGRESLTRVAVLKRTLCSVDGLCTDVVLYPATGRKHQLRRHCAEVLRAPILGDDLYTTQTPRSSIESRSEADGCDASQKSTDLSVCGTEIVVRKRIGLFLYCRRISVPHPEDSSRMVSAEIPEPYRFAKHRRKAKKGWDWNLSKATMGVQEKPIP